MDGEPLTRRWRIDPERASLSIDRLVVRRGRVLHVDSVQLRADRREMAAEREAGGRATGTRREHNVVERERLGRRRRTPSSSRLGGGGRHRPLLARHPPFLGRQPPFPALCDEFVGGGDVCPRAHRRGASHGHHVRLPPLSAQAGSNELVELVHRSEVAAVLVIV